MIERRAEDGWIEWAGGKMSDPISVTVNDGKYTIQQTEPGKWEALRYGEEWPAFRDSGPDNLHVALAYEIANLREKIAAIVAESNSLIFRLDDLDLDDDADDLIRDWNGHVEPPLARLRSLVGDAK